MKGKIKQNKLLCGIFTLLLWGCTLVVCQQAIAADNSLCARVKIEIRQELTLERQAFDAHMAINNGLSHITLENVKIDVTFANKAGEAVLASFDPNDPNALFFIRIHTMENIDDVNGSGAVAPSTAADIHWLIIPAPGAANEVQRGTLYYVGATLTYTIGGKEHITEVTPDYIFVKPMPELMLDYFIPHEVYGDDAFTPETEPPVPFNLGVRVSNTGHGTAYQLKIDSAQPKIKENELGLLVGFEIVGATVNGSTVSPSLLANFGNIEPESCGTAHWTMTCSLSGKFTEFTAGFTHSDELGGTLTSLLTGTDTHYLVRDVVVDLPGRDSVRDFLAKDGDVLRVYESSGVDTTVTDQSANATLQCTGQIDSMVDYTLNAPPTIGFLYIKLPDPYNGTKEVTRIMRSDGKLLSLDNVWLSKTRREDNTWDFFINVFDVNSTGRYTLKLGEPCEPCTDCDHDGMPDAWEQQIIDADPNDAIETIDGVQPEDDFDGDGWSNLQEYLGGTDPTDPLDHPVAPVFDEDFETGDLCRFPWVTTGAGVWSVTTATNHTTGGMYAAEAPALGDTESASLEVRMYCDQGNISFWYAVSSEQDHDLLHFYIDDIEQGAWSGEVSQTQTTFAVTSGMHTFRWVYAKDKSGSSGADTAWVDDIFFPMGIDSDFDGMPDGWETANGLNPLFNDADADPDGDGFSNYREYVADTNPQDGNDFPSVEPEVEDFETGDLSRFPWVTTGAGVWSLTTATNHTTGGMYAAEAPALGDTESAALEVRTYCDKGNISFWYAVSSEQDHDLLHFHIDDIEQGTWSGEVPLTQATFAVTSGMHTFRWMYEKNKSDASGADTAWVDDISLPVGIDSDNDGMPDGWEIENSLKPWCNDAQDDTDGGGLINIEEYKADLDPLDPSDDPIIILSGWSMVSLPIDATDKRLKAVFPNAVVVYGYEKGTGYVRIKSDEELTVGKGYWILLDQATSYTITGQPIESYTLPANEDGWAMIGGCTDPAQVIPHGCNIGVIYGYTQGTGYQRVTGHLERGKGYWILLNNVTAGGTISVETVD